MLALSSLRSRPITELLELARSLRVDGASSMRRQELVVAVLSAQAQTHGTIDGEGVLECLGEGFGFLRASDAHYAPAADDVYVSPSQIRRFALRTGDRVRGTIRPPREGERYFALLKVEAVNDTAPDDHAPSVVFEELTPVWPSRRVAMEMEADDATTRAVDLFAPIALGQRQLVVGPPRAPLAALTRKRAMAIARADRSLAVGVLLLDARPEDVSDAQRAMHSAANAVALVAATFDEPAARQVQAAELALERAKRLVESKRDVVLFVDGLGALARAHHAAVPNARVTIDGIDAAALQKARRFFAAARALQEGGSLTLVATLAVDEQSDVDAVVAESFRSTATSEVHFDAQLLAAGHAPAIDIARTSTDGAERFVDARALAKLTILREKLRRMDRGAAMIELRESFRRASTNAALLDA